MPSTLRRAAILLALALLVSGLVPARAEEDDAPLRVALFQVGMLTSGRTDFIPCHPPTVGPGEVTDEENPLFGTEAEEPILPLGTIDELIEVTKNAVSPWFWEERSGADIRSSGEHLLVVRATPEVLGLFGAYLAGLESRFATVVTVDVHAVRLSLEERRALSARPDPGRLRALLESTDAGPSLSLTALSAARASAFAGTRQAWICDQDVEVAENSSSSDPTVMVGNVGLIVDVRSTPSADGKTVLLELGADLSKVSAWRTDASGVTGIVETPAFDLLTTNATVRVPSGQWTLLDGAGSEGGAAGWHFLVRATPRTTRCAPRRIDLPATPRRTIGPMEQRYFPVSQLTVAPCPRLGYAPIPVPSSYTPPEPPELAEPYPCMPEEGIVDLVREMGGADGWEDPATIEIRNRIVIARNAPPMLDGIERVLAALRAGAIWSMDTTLEVVEAPTSVARHLGTGGVLEDRAQGLLADALQSGQASRLESVTVTSMRDTRNAVTSGQVVSYIQDYEVEIAQGTAIHNPVPRSFLDGVSADVTPGRTADGNAIKLTLRFLRAHQRGPMRKVRTGPVPEISLPEVETFDLRSDLLVPVGRTSVVGVWGEGGRRRLLLVTPRSR